MEEVLLFSAGSRCAIPLKDTDEVLRIVQSEPPGRAAPPWDGGTINLHGSLVPVIVMRALFGLMVPVPAPSEMLLITRAGGRSVALRVDAISGTGTQPPALDSSDQAGNSRAVLPGIYVSSDGVHVIQDAGALFQALAGKDARSFIPLASEPVHRYPEDRLHLPGPESRSDAVSVAMLLEERARILAHPVENPPGQKSAKVLKFTLADREFGIPLSAIREVVLTGRITRVPGTPAYIAGICIIRGEIISLVDLRVLLPIPHTGITDMNRVIVVSGDTLTLGLLADRITGLEDLDEQWVSQVPEDSAEYTEGRRKLVNVVKDGALTVIDTATLFSDPRMIIDES